MSNKKIPTSIMMPQELLQRLDADAANERRSRSNVVVIRLLRDYKMDEKLAEGDGNADKA